MLEFYVCFRFKYTPKLETGSTNMTLLNGAFSTADADTTLEDKGPPYVLVVRHASRYQFLKQIRDILELSSAIPELASLIRSELTAVSSVFLSSDVVLLCLIYCIFIDIY